MLSHFNPVIKLHLIKRLGSVVLMFVKYFVKTMASGDEYGKILPQNVKGCYSIYTYSPVSSNFIFALIYDLKISFCYNLFYFIHSIFISHMI